MVALWSTIFLHWVFVDMSDIVMVIAIQWQKEKIFYM